MNVVPIPQVPSEQLTAACPNCSSPVLADQRYCLQCGQPCSPVRLAFLDVLQAENQVRRSAPLAQVPLGYQAPPLSPGTQHDGWLRRYAGLFSLVSILLTTGLIGLLIGHWLTPAKAPSTQVIKLQGSGLPLASSPQSAATAASTGEAPSSSSASKQSASSSGETEAQEKREVKEAETPKAKAPAPVKASSNDLQKISKLSGKKHEQAIEKLVAGDKPIETGG